MPSLLDRFISLYAPHLCFGCGREGSPLCSGCGAMMRRPPGVCLFCGAAAGGGVCAGCREETGLSCVCAAAEYEGVAAELVKRLKFQRAQAVAETLAEYMATVSAPESGALVTFVPTSPARRRRRGYDQAELIARGLARRLGLPMRPLLRRRGGQRQVGAGRVRRLEQAQGMFAALAVPGGMPRGSVLLVDDVFTTGSTLRAAAGELRASGAGGISAAVFARTP